ncbi:enoyl-CoA hydratase/isomerase family protein [Variovorax sp. J22R24]|uniref:enoyl-CoA hydratase/isomerase family protein n=1 Tax=Variovorax gracilis TaxID=3053502 RepID=UPI00257712FA|nr:enoyl-CoA hydratase/isomerase family protein [Variovorax sp. J22R24]MDM0109468.1 enoyl-CoA hydratase/isomerase family protein [Variovorax sp. J22R24]
MTDTKITIEREDRYAIIFLDNAPMNVVSAPLTRQLYAALKSLESDDTVRALVLTGAGSRAFCAGSDISELTEMSEPGAALEKKLIFQNKVFETLRSFPKPTIAALNGYTYGGGLEIAACCDLIVAEAQVKLCLPEIKLGVFPSSGGTYRVARRIGESRTKEMIFLGEPITAAQAHNWGLVNRLVEQGTALAEAKGIAQTLAKGPSLALHAAKSIVNLAFDRSDAEAVGESLKASDRVFCSADAKEGIAAFLQKRPAAFS